MAKQKKMTLSVVNQNAAAIDVGSRSHFVAIGQKLENVKEFGVYAEDLTCLRKWLQEEGVTTVAMESTGDYWQNLHAELERAGLVYISVQTMPAISAELCH